MSDSAHEQVIRMVESLEQDKTENVEQVLYVIGHPHGYYKIGVSANPLRRLQDLQTACPYELDIIGFAGFENPTKAESVLHERFSQYQKRGEWFELPDQIVGILIDDNGAGLQSVVRENSDYTTEVSQ